MATMQNSALKMSSFIIMTERATAIVHISTGDWRIDTTIELQAIGKRLLAVSDGQ